MDWSETNSCIKCDKGGKLLVCSENGCPLAVHKQCLGCPVRVDDAGRFFCPYCLYKQAVAESRKARENALARKKALLIFMDGKVISSEKDMGENKTCEDNGNNQSKSSDTNIHITSCDDGKSKSNNDGIIDQPSPLGEEEKISDAEEDSEASEASEASADSKGRDPSPKVNGENGHRIAEEKQVQEEERETSAEEQIQEEERETSGEEEKIQEEECETSSASTNQDSLPTVRARAKRGSERSKPANKDSEDVPVQSKLLKQHGKKPQASPTVTPSRRYATRSSPAKSTGKVVNKEFSSPRRSRKTEESSSRLASGAFGSAKRKRLMWSEEEEEVLREGVKRHPKKANAKVPWRKILEEDRDKFDATRTPADLKDKWRNMSGRKRESKHYTDDDL